MRSFTNSHQVLLSSALVACHASFREQGFRQRDLRFYFELFARWAERGGVYDEEQIQITQLTRYLSDLAEQGYIKKLNRNSRSPFVLSRLGLIEMITRIVAPNDNQPHNVFYFAFYFIRVYRDRLIALVKEEGKQFPVALQVELEALLDYDSMLKEKISSVKKRLTKLSRGLEDALGSSKLAGNLMRRNIPLEEVIQQVEGKFPYEFNALKPLSELMKEIPPEARAFELEKGNALRVKMLWEPMYALEEQFLAQLNRLKKGV